MWLVKYILVWKRLSQHFLGTIYLIVLLSKWMLLEINIRTQSIKGALILTYLHEKSKLTKNEWIFIGLVRSCLELMYTWLYCSVSRLPADWNQDLNHKKSRNLMTILKYQKLSDFNYWHCMYSCKPTQTIRFYHLIDIICSYY